MTSYVPGTDAGARCSREQEEARLLSWSSHPRGALVRSTGEQTGWVSRCGAYHVGLVIEALGVDGTPWKGLQKRRGPWTEQGTSKACA